MIEIRRKKKLGRRSYWRPFSYDRDVICFNLNSYRIDNKIYTSNSLKFQRKFNKAIVWQQLMTTNEIPY